MGLHSKNKGKVGEREVAAVLKRHGFDARRGQQFSGGDDSPDVKHDMEGFHIEVKRTERLNLNAAIAQANEDKTDKETALVVHRSNRQPWLVTMEFEAFVKLMSEFVYQE